MDWHIYQQPPHRHQSNSTQTMHHPPHQVCYPLHAAGHAFYRQFAAAGGIDLESGRGLPSSPSQQQQQQQHKRETAAGQRLGAEFDLTACTGDYRKILHVPQDLEWKLVRYSHPDQDDLLTTDLQALQQREREAKRAAPPAPPPPAAADDQLQPGLVLPPPPPLPGDELRDQQQQQEAEEEEAATGAGEKGGGGGSQQQELLGLQLEFSLPASCYATMLLRELTKECTSKAAHKAASRLFSSGRQHAHQAAEEGGSGEEEALVRVAAGDQDEEMAEEEEAALCAV